MKTEILKADADIQAACESLKEHVDLQKAGPSILMRVGGVYKETNPKAIQTVKVSGVEIGYRIKAFITHMTREVFVKIPGYKIDDLKKSERDRILTAIFNVFIVPTADVPEIAQIAPDCMLIRQNVIPIVMVERNPRLRAIAGRA